MLCHFGFGCALVYAATHSARPLATSAIPVTLVAFEEAAPATAAPELALPSPPAPIAPPRPAPRKRATTPAHAPAPRPALTPVAPAPVGASLGGAFVGHGDDTPDVEAEPVARRAPSVLARPSYARNPAPAYPASARRRRQQGLVVLRVEVTALGRAAAVELARSSGVAALDESALLAVRDWEFEPARLGPRPVECEIEVPVRFALDD